MTSLSRNAFAVLLAATAFPAVAGAQTFSADRIKADMSFLADDLLEGRNAGDRGYDLAALYVAKRFEALGLKPAGVNGSYYQPVTFTSASPDDNRPSAIVLNGKRYPVGPEFFLSPSILGDSIAGTADLVFVGYGIDSPELGINDYAGLDVKGKVVVMLPGAPSTIPPEIASTLNRGEAFQKRGALGAISIYPPEAEARFPWEMVLKNAGGSRVTWVDAKGVPFADGQTTVLNAMASSKGTALLFQGAPKSWAQIAEEMKDTSKSIKGFALPAKVTIERNAKSKRFVSSNVLGMIEGSDPKLKAETVLLTAHLDHDGIVPKNAKNGDTIMNGAMDNAAGISTMLEAARAFVDSGKKPKRSIVFAAVTAEEDGLLGSEYLSINPTAATARTVANVNLDMPILTYDFEDIFAPGADQSTMGAIAAAAVKKIGVTMSPDPVPEERLFVRSDHYSFVKRGIPALFLVTGQKGVGKAGFEDFLKNHYHQVDDDMKLPIKWDAAVRFAKVNYMIASEIADAPVAPRWYEGSYFGDKFAPKAPRAKKP